MTAFVASAALIKSAVATESPACPPSAVVWQALLASVQTGSAGRVSY
jgi:hypothetical protein